MALSENQVIYHRGGRGGTQSFETVFSPLRDSAHSAVESKGMASSLEKSTVPLVALSGNPVISVMVSWICNNAKDVKTEIDNTLRVSLAFLVKLKNNNAKARWRKEQKSHSVFHWDFRLCLFWLP